MNRSLLAIAHRGYSSRFPENTPAAFAGACDLGVFAVETDVRLTADNVPVCMHDPDLLRLARRPERIAETTLDEARKILHEAGRELCLLEDAFRLMKSIRGRLLLDVKVPSSLPLIHELLERLAMPLDAVVLGLRSVDQVRVWRAMDTRRPVLGFLEDVRDIPAFLAEGGTVIRFWEEDLMREPDLVKLAGKTPFWVMAGARASGCGETTPERIEAVRALGAEALLLNDPALLLSRAE